MRRLTGSGGIRTRELMTCLACLIGTALLCGAVWFAPRRAAGDDEQPATKPGQSDTRPAAPSTQPRVTTRPTPPAREAVVDAERLVREVFVEAFAPAAPDAPGAAERKAAFGRRFLVQGIMADDDPGMRFVLLREARDFAAASGDSATAMRAVGRLQSLCGVGPMETRESALVALATAAKVVTSPGAPDVQAEDNARAFVQFIEAALAVGDYDLAARAAAAANPVAARVKDPMLQAMLNGQPGEPGALAATWELAGLEEESAAAKAAMEKLRADPGDAQSNAVAGAYLCFTRGDWDAGLPMLAQGSDAEWKALVGRESGVTDARSAVAVANAWWDAAGARTGRARLGAWQRAAHWYLRAAPDLVGLAREVAESRLREMRLLGRRPGLIADLYDGETYQRWRATRIDPNVDFSWGEGPADARLGFDHFSICWQGFIQAPEPGRYELEVLADDGVIVLLDGRVVINEWHSASGPPHRRIVDLTGQTQGIEVMYYEISAGTTINVRWRGPGESKAVAVPASALGHDPVWPWGPTARPWAARPPDAVPCTAADGTTVWFKLFSEGLPWHAARRRCERMGGHLAWARKPEHHDCLSRVCGKESVWLGAADDEIENRWEWTDDQRVELDLSNWLEGEPGGGRDENYMGLLQSRGWYDQHSMQYYICEWDQ